MGVKKSLDEQYITAMKAKDAFTVNCIRQVRAKVQEFENQKGFEGEVDDALYDKAIGAYVKMLKKALVDLDATHELYQQYQKEIEFLAPFLPQLLSEAETESLVDGIIAGGANNVGQIMGQLMKEHKGKVDPALAKQLIAKKLA
jgi:uncharacterized protein YqeY